MRFFILLLPKRNMAIKRLLAFLLVLIALSLLAIYYPNLTGNTSKHYYDFENIQISRVIDGDTLEIISNQGVKESVRLLGINAPEKNMPQSKKAKDFLEQFLNRSISMLRDKEDKDKYNRKLRYIFSDNRNINLEILENGLANSYYTQGLIYEDQLLRAEKQAQKNKIGIWQESDEKCSEENCIILKDLNSDEEFFIIKNECNFECTMEGWFVKDSGRNTFMLSQLNANEEERYNSKLTKTKTDIWQTHDHFFMFDDQGFLVLYYEF